MSARTPNNRKALVSVAEMARMLEMSRARFYQLLAQNVFPKPSYDSRTKRPYYDLKNQQICLEVRQTGIGFDGRYILFYPPRKKNNSPPKPSAPKPKPSADPMLSEVYEALAQMGLDFTTEQVSEAVQKAFPEGMNGAEIGLVVREVFRILRGNG